MNRWLDTKKTRPNPFKSRITFTILLLITMLTMLAGFPAPLKVAAIGDQELRVNLGGEPAHIDPNLAFLPNERSVILQCFEGLVGYNPDLTLKPVVAVELPSIANGGISPDGKIYTFHLKSDRRWSDGELVTADDFEYSIKRLLSPEINPEPYLTYASFYFNIVGAEAYYNSAELPPDEIEARRAAVGVTAIDSLTLEIRLNNIQPTFLQLMAMWPAYPVRQDIITQFGDSWTTPPNYIGNGPFILSEWVHNDHMIFIRNPLYSGIEPALTKITYKMIDDVNVALTAYMNNELDISMVPGGQEKTTIADPTLSPQIVQYLQLVTMAFQFNLTKAPFDNKLLRQALSTAIDRNAFIDQVRGGVGHPTTSWIPPGMPGYDPNLGSQYTFNVTLARQLLAQAGYPNGVDLPELKFQYNDTFSMNIIAQFLKNQLQTNLGISLTLQPMNQQALNSLINTKQFDWCWWGWGADYPDPDNWLPNIFSTNGGSNKSGYSNTQFDLLAASALQETDNTTRLALWAQAQAIMVDDAPMVFLFNRGTFALKKPWVEGLLTTGMDYSGLPGEMFFSNIHVSMSSIVSISPSSVMAGSPGFTMTVNGLDFLPGYTLKWRDATETIDLATTFVSATQFTATIPAYLINDAKTADIYLVQDNSQVSNLLPLFVTESSTQVSNSSSGTSNTPCGMVTASTGGTGPSTPGSVTATALGTGTTTVAQFASNPGGLPTFESAGSYFDVHVSHDSNITDLTIVVGSLNGSNVAYWWNGTQWIAASNQTYNPALSTITIQVTSLTLPSLSDLEGCIFGMANHCFPILGILNLPVDPVDITTVVNGSASFTDLDLVDTHTGIWNWGDSTTSAAIISETNGYVTATGNHNYAAAGVYEVKLTVTDSYGAIGQSVFQYIVIYDPSAGFVTGGGWIDSPAGAYIADPSLAGKASFGFVSKYLKGTTIPTGNTEFQFKAGDLNFKSTSYAWLVVAGSKAIFKGEGTINGTGTYQFMLTAEDEPDTFRIQITGAGGLVYDNGSQHTLSGGSIVIHK